MAHPPSHGHCLYTALLAELRVDATAVAVLPDERQCQSSQLTALPEPPEFRRVRALECPRSAARVELAVLGLPKYDAVDPLLVPGSERFECHGISNKNQQGPGGSVVGDEEPAAAFPHTRV